MTGDLDIAALRAWIGRTETSVDTLTPRLAREYAAMLDRDPGEEFAPLAIHWCLAPPAAPAAALGPDGHPARGLFLPPVPLPRRMWAGGELRLHGRLRVGDLVTRTSRIADVTVKQGRAGILCFVTVEHELTGPRGLAISETQDIVYRDLETAAVPVPGAAPARRAVPREAGWRRDKGADAVLLFRYSALTFNGHRIHYDRAYAVGVEAYPGLVVHGPLQSLAGRRKNSSFAVSARYLISTGFRYAPGKWKRGWNYGPRWMARPAWKRARNCECDTAICSC